MHDVSNVLFAREAQHDLDDIYDWIAQDTSPERADLVVARIWRLLERLAALPGMGRKQLDVPGQPQAYPLRRWRVYYVTNPHRTGITILRILDCRRDIQRAFDQPE